MPAKSSVKLKSLWHASGRGLSLKTFVRELAESGKEEAQSAKDWFLNKTGVSQKKEQEARLKRKAPMLEQMRQAKKAG
jgi:hypothetical protein